jgi:cytochrome oxidase assembly protein ShyY1
LRLVAGGTVWVNRGFAPDGRHHLADRKEFPDSETTTLIGLIRPDEYEQDAEGE